MNPDQMPLMPTTSWQFYAFVAWLTYQAAMATIAYFQNKKQIENQGDMKRQLNGAAVHAQAAAQALGVAEGKIQGAATERAQGIEDRAREGK